MKILVLNSGSSSLKRAFYDWPDPQREPESSPDAIGVRVVHGGAEFTAPTRVDDAVLARIMALSDLAPLHNPAAAKLIEQTRANYRDVPIVAVFDTAFHATLPPVASSYALPAALGVRRFGFHGISYSYVSSRVDATRHIICHLGNGASVCALRDGRSVDTSMGFTPMEGLVMGTRAGDVDPGVLLYLMRKGQTEQELDELLNRRSGLLGVSESSGDVRALEKAANNGDPRADFALELFAYRASRYIGAYAAVLGGVDALTFTAGVGEHSASMRTRICSNLAFLGIELDQELNHARRNNERVISSGTVLVRVIPTDEELEIARSTHGVMLKARS